MAHEPQHIPGTMSNLQLLAHVAALDALGIDADGVLDRVGLRRAQFADPAGRIASGIEFPLWDATIDLCGDPAIGLRAGQQISFEALGSYGFLLRASTTFRQLLERADKFIRLIDDLARIDSREEGDRLIVRIYRTGGYPIPGPSVDCLFAAISTVMLKLLPRPALRQATMRFAHRPPAEIGVYEQILGCTVEFDAPHHELDSPLAWADVPVPYADAKLGEVLQDHASLLLERLPEADALLQTVRTQLIAQLERGEASLPALARALHLSERTLRRRLAERGTSYQAMLDELRSSLACKLVEQGAQSVDAIASKLGFADTSSFFHAFKRWTGKTPAQFRREQRGGG